MSQKKIHKNRMIKEDIFEETQIEICPVILNEDSVCWSYKEL